MISKKKLERQIRRRAWENRHGIYLPTVEGDRKRANWPVCMTCHHDVDSVNVEDIQKSTVVIRAKCHGEEAVIKLQFPYSILRRTDEETWEHVRTALANATFFEPGAKDDD